MSNILKIAGAGSAAAAEETDENFNQTVLLLHGDGTNGAQNNTFLDSSTNNFTITRSGNTTQGTFSPFSVGAGEWSNYFDGTGDTLNTASNAAFGFGTGSWTLEAWVYPTTAQTDNWILATNDAGKLRMRVGASGYLSFYTDTGSISLDSTTVVTVNAWNHVAICYDGTNLSLFQNGTRTATTTASINNGSANSLYVGSNTIGGSYWNGYISNARVLKGTALYSGATYTVPTSPLTNITNTSLLTCQSNRFVDNSTNNFAITRNGDVKVTPFSPFAPTAAYSPSVNGGSSYHDGSGDYLTLTDASNDLDLGGRAASLDFWLYSGNLSTTQIYCQKVGTANAYDPSDGIEYALYISSGTLTFAYYTSGSSSATITSANLKANQWNHICIATDASNNIALFVNGVRDATASNAIGKPTTRTTFYIARSISGIAAVSGYLSGFNFIAGANAYDPTDTTITIPTAPPTAISGTELLLNFTNAGIFDNTGKNNLETVGNAQIDTTVKKYGTGSMEFDGTDDRLTNNNFINPDLIMGTGSYTIEGWIYTTSTSNLGVLQISDTSGGLKNNQTNTIAIYCNNLALGAYYNDTYQQGTTAVSSGTWTHFALVRDAASSNQLKLYVNGTADSGFSTQTDNRNYTGGYIVVGGYFGTSNLFNGYIDDLRITKGVARYTSNFTAPTKAFPDL